MEIEKFYTLEETNKENMCFTSWYGPTEGRLVKRLYAMKADSGNKVLLRSWVAGECVMYKSNFSFENIDCQLDPDLDINA